MRYLLDIIKGSLIGIANIIPGLSGGTLAVVMGIYDKLISSITTIFKHPIATLKNIWLYISGIGLGLLFGVFGISYLLENFEVQTSSLFIGLIIGAIPLIFRQIDIKDIKVKNVLVFSLLFLAVASLPFLSKLGITSSSSNPLIYFIIGVISAATMVIPGVSGSMVLMSFGYYDSVILLIKDTISNLLLMDFSALGSSISLLLPMTFGILVGIIAIAKLITWLFSNHKQITICGILGLIVASPIVVFSELDYSEISILSIITSILTLGLGFAIAHYLNKIEEKD